MTDAQSPDIAAEFAAFQAWKASQADQPTAEPVVHVVDPVDILLTSLRLDRTPANRDTVAAWCEQQGFGNPHLPAPPEPQPIVQPNYGAAPASVAPAAAPVAAQPTTAAVDPTTGLPSLAGAPPVVDPTTGEPVA